MSKNFKGKGFVQITGRNMSTLSAQPISSISLSNTQSASGSSVLGQYSQAIPSGLLNQTLTVSNSTTSNSGMWANIFTTEEHSGQHYKKYEIYEFVEDVLALSCAWKRQRDTEPGVHKFDKLTNKILAASVTSEDRELARNIRDYYSKKLMMLNLRGDRLTSFRKDLNSYIHGNPCKVTQDMFPLIYRLPEFYVYDGKIDEIKVTLENRVRGEKLQKFHGKSTTYKITPIISTSKNNKRIKVAEYWFNEENNIPVMIQLDPKNPLLHIWDNIFNSQTPIKVIGKSFAKKLDDFEYLSISDWKLTEG